MEKSQSACVSSILPVPSMFYLLNPHRRGSQELGVQSCAVEAEVRVVGCRANERQRREATTSL